MKLTDKAIRNLKPQQKPYKKSDGEGLQLRVYDADIRALFRLAAGYVDKILRGAKPSELPVEQPTKFDLVINLKTAKALGLTIPDKLLALANDVVE